MTRFATLARMGASGVPRRLPARAATPARATDDPGPDDPRPSQAAGRRLALVCLAALALISLAATPLAALAALSVSAVGQDRVVAAGAVAAGAASPLWLAVGPPWVDLNAVANRAGGRLASPQQAPLARVVAGAGPDFPARLREAGAWLVLDARRLAQICGVS